MFETRGESAVVERRIGRRIGAESKNNEEGECVLSASTPRGMVRRSPNLPPRSLMRSGARQPRGGRAWGWLNKQGFSRRRSLHPLLPRPPHYLIRYDKRTTFRRASSPFLYLSGSRMRPFHDCLHPISVEVHRALGINQFW